MWVAAQTSNYQAVTKSVRNYLIRLRKIEFE